MSARQRIESAENAILFAKQRAVSERSDPDHAAAVELESRRLLVDAAEVERQVRERLASLIDKEIAAHTGEFPGLPLFGEGLREARRIVMGVPDHDVDGSPGDLFDEPSHPVVRCERCGKHGPVTEEMDAGGNGLWFCKTGCQASPAESAGGGLS